MECKFEGCTKKHRTGGLCQGHHAQRTAGKELSPLRARKVKYVGCSQAGCLETHYSLGLCHSHYEKSRRGTLNKQPRFCEADGCEEAYYSKNKCKSHFNKWYYNFRQENPKPINTLHWNYKADSQSFETIHNRVRASRGTPRHFPCTDCAGQANEWSLKHDAPGKFKVEKPGHRDDGSFISLDVMDYEPRCTDCHRAYDAKHGNRKYKTGEHAYARVDAS